MEKELKEEKEKKEKRKKYLENKLNDIINTARNGNEAKNGVCSKNESNFKAGITEADDLVKFIDLSESESVFQCDYKFLQSQEKKLEKTLSGKIIVGWLLKSEHENENGGSWQRNSTVLGTSSYSFTVRSSNTRGCHWKLSIWAVDKNLPLDMD